MDVFCEIKTVMHTIGLNEKVQQGIEWKHTVENRLVNTCV